jgi:amidophosphoribosyltransferase
MSFGIVGVYGKGILENTARITSDALLMYHHRSGREYPVIATNKRGNDPFTIYGLDYEGFRDIKLEELDSDKSDIGIGRIYDKSHPGPSGVGCAAITAPHGIVVVENGKLTNLDEMKGRIYKRGIALKSEISSKIGTSSADILMHLIACSGKENIKDALTYSLDGMKGSYCFILMLDDRLAVVRDRHGHMPLSLGSLRGAPIIASETSAFSRIGAEYKCDIGEGELMVFDSGTSTSYQLFESDPRHCIRELVYFANPGSRIFGGQRVSKYRFDSGIALAKEHEVTLKDIDIIVPVPESGRYAAISLSEESRKPYRLGLVEAPGGMKILLKEQKDNKKNDVRDKLYPDSDIVSMKRVALVEDSGITFEAAREISNMMDEAGAREVHWYFASPPPRNRCPYRESIKHMEGIRGEDSEINDKVLDIISDGGVNKKVKSVNFLSLETTLNLTGRPDEYCYQCLTEKDLYDDV